MKKTYIQPRTKIHALRTSRMLAGSEPGVNDTVTNAEQLGKEDEDINFGW